ncbi:MAG: hypothetical protein ABR923_21090 [Terracidiphilus sp.]|jgi:hypothetical protein
MLLELARAFSFFLSMLSLYPVLVSAFFVPGKHWQERLSDSLLYVILAGCMCLISGLLFAHPSPANPEGDRLLTTLPIRLLFFALAGMAVLFALAWYLDLYFAPQLRHGCCRP